ncbi:MAG: leucine-rich repeat domain-containing protein [Alphaproteobacteria bacterium]|nr:leucine-rich repeat domain-containing protein [Alphaproteobacteria bacterium]
MKYYLFLFSLFVSSSSIAIVEDESARPSTPAQLTRTYLYDELTSSSQLSTSLSAPSCSTDILQSSPQASCSSHWNKNEESFPSRPGDLIISSSRELNAILENPDHRLSRLKLNFTPTKFQLSLLTKQLSSLRFLDLSDTDVTDDEIAPLVALKGLKYLDLNSTNVRNVEAVFNSQGQESASSESENNILRLHSHPNLKINLQYTLKNLPKFTTEGEFKSTADVLRGGESMACTFVEDLKELYPMLNDPRIQRISGFELCFPTTSRHLQHITTRISMKNLTSLGLSGSAIMDISTLGTLEGLIHLDLSFTGITNISPLAMSQQLRELYLQNTGVKNVSPLAALKKLHELDLSFTGITDISPLAGLLLLNRLNLTATDVRDISPLAEIKRLEFFDLIHTAITNVSPLYSKNRMRFYTTNIGRVHKHNTTLENVSRQLERYRGDIHLSLFEHLWLKFSPELEQES